MRHSGRIDDYFDLVDRCKPAASVALRHDLCSTTLPHALAFAKAEAARGLRATYYPLHTERYWNDRAFPDFCRALVDLNHRVDLHHDALTVFVRSARAPRDTLLRALDFLRQHVEVTSAASHGSPDAYSASGALRFCNYEVFDHFDPAKNIGGAMGWKFQRANAKELGLTEVYLDGDFTRYISDSAGSWRGWVGPPRPKPFERIDHGMTEGLAALDGIGPDDRIMVLSHPCYWRLS